MMCEVETTKQAKQLHRKGNGSVTVLKYQKNDINTVFSVFLYRRDKGVQGKYALSHFFPELRKFVCK